MDRNLVMTAHMRRCLEEGDSSKGRKPVKAQDLVRVYETTLSNLNEQPALAGLEEDLEFRSAIEASVSKGFMSFVQIGLFQSN